MPPRKTTSAGRRPALPRVPLPLKAGRVHEDKTKRPHRKAKYKRPPRPDE